MRGEDNRMTKIGADRAGAELQQDSRPGLRVASASCSITAFRFVMNRSIKSGRIELK